MPEFRAAGLEKLFLRIEARDRLSDSEKQALSEAAGERRSYPAGADIVREGDRPNASTLLLSGMASRYNFLSDGRRQITAVHVAGDFVDLHSFPLQRMDHSVGALTACEVLAFPHAALRKVTDEHPHLTRLLWMLTLLDGAIHRRWLVAMGRMSAVGQAAHFLCETYLRLEGVGAASDHRMALPITQAELADILGLSAVHANRVLQELRGLEVLRWDGKEVCIPDWSRLARLGEFTDEYLFRERLPR